MSSYFYVKSLKFIKLQDTFFNITNMKERNAVSILIS